MCFPWVDVSQTVVFPPFIDNFVVQMVERAESRKVVAYDDLSVTLEWRRSGGGGSMTSPVVRGAPYGTFIMNNITPMFTTVHAIVGITDTNVSCLVLSCTVSVWYNIEFLPCFF